MLKNLLAAIGLFVVGQKSYELYREYSSLKREKEQQQQAGQPATSQE